MTTGITRYWLYVQERALADEGLACMLPGEVTMLEETRIDVQQETTQAQLRAMTESNRESFRGPQARTR